jgi:gluconolactonase
MPPTSFRSSTAGLPSEARRVLSLILPGLFFGCGSSSSPATATAPDASTAKPAALADGGAGKFAPLKFSEIGKPTKVGDQFYFTEGPVWDPAKGVLYFTDINGPPPAVAADAAAQGASTGGAVYQLTPPSTFVLFVGSSGNTDGLGLDPQGNLIGAGFASREVWRFFTSGKSTSPVDGALKWQTLAPCAQGSGTCYMGQEINTPDDITARSDGTIYFTDPTFANGGQGFPVQNLPLANAQGVYRLTTDGVLHLEDSTTSGPNGVNFSPDEKTLYVSYTLASAVAKFDVAADGSLSHKTMFATGAMIADSMCVDAGGNVYVGTFSGLSVYDPKGDHLGTISVDGQIVTNCAFGGADQKTLFITARTTATLAGTPPLGGGLLYQISDMPVPGMPGRN